MTEQHDTFTLPQLPPLAFDRDRDEWGTFYSGVCAIGARDDYQFAIVAPSVASLEFAWNRAMVIPLDKSRIQRVRIYEDKRKDGDA